MHWQATGGFLGACLTLDQRKGRRVQVGTETAKAARCYMKGRCEELVEQLLQRGFGCSAADEHKSEQLWKYAAWFPYSTRKFHGQRVVVKSMVSSFFGGLRGQRAAVNPLDESVDMPRLACLGCLPLGLDA